MSVDWRSVRGHALVVAAVVGGILGMGMVFSGVMDASLHEVSRGVPLLLVGLWWAGRELGRSMRASRTRSAADAVHGVNLPAANVNPEKGHARADR